MARTKAADYDARRAAIVERAAELYAQRGFQGASLADLAKACRTSKSLIYHYYSSKEDILFDVMHSHVGALLAVAEEISLMPGSPKQKLHALTGAFMRLYAGAATRQKVLLNELSRLPKKRRTAIVAIQRKLIDIVQNILCAMRPNLAPSLGRPATMLYFGMINWTHTWMDPSGPEGPEQIAELAVKIYLNGFVEPKMRPKLWPPPPDPIRSRPDP